MRTLGDHRRKTSAQDEKPKETPVKAEESTSIPADSSETFDESVVIN